MKISPQQVQKIATLARIELDEDEIEKYSQQLTQILDYIDMLKEVDTSNVQPTYQTTGNINIWREDIVIDSSEKTVEDIISLAPEKVDRFIKVKKVL